MRPAPLAVAVLTTLVTFSMGAWPGPGAKHPAGSLHATELSGAALHFGKSIGSPTQGHLVGGAHLDESPYLRVVPAYAHSDVRWGLEPLVTLIDRAARAVRRQFPDATTSVGHLSRAGGGELDRHHSHESGRDADIGFFMKNHAGHPHVADRFIAFKPDGNAQHVPGVVFDDLRNWTFVAALLTDPHAHVTHIFVEQRLRARLLAMAERLGAAPAVKMRAAEVMQQPRGALPHDDHFHIRIACPAHMRECVEYPTSAHLAHAVSPVSHGRSRSARAGHDTAPRAAVPHHNAPPSTPRDPRAPLSGSILSPAESDDTTAPEDIDAAAMRPEDPDGL